MRYTTGWAQKDVKTQEQWAKWLNSLQKGDRVLFQQFIPKGNSCLDSQIECWRFWDATFQGDRVRYDNESHPLKDGRSIYWNSDSLSGDVFGGRIVPWHRDVAPQSGDRFADCHAPVFEPFWQQYDRIFVLVPYSPDIHKCAALMRSCNHRYSRDVNGGVLYTIFGEEVESVKKLCAESDLKSPPIFLYSESTRD